MLGKSIDEQGAPCGKLAEPKDSSYANFVLIGSRQYMAWPGRCRSEGLRNHIEFHERCTYNMARAFVVTIIKGHQWKVGLLSGSASLALCGCWLELAGNAWRAGSGRP